MALITNGSIINATGGTVTYVTKKGIEWSAVFTQAPPEEIANNVEDPGTFQCVKDYDWQSGSAGAVVYSGNNKAGSKCDWMLAWYVSDDGENNKAYTEVHEAGHFNDPIVWPPIRNNLMTGCIKHTATWNGCISSVTIDYGIHTKFGANLSLKNDVLITNGSITNTTGGTVTYVTKKDIEWNAVFTQGPPEEIANNDVPGEFRCVKDHDWENGLTGAVLYEGTTNDGIKYNCLLAWYISEDGKNNKVYTEVHNPEHFVDVDLVDPTVWPTIRNNLMISSSNPDTNTWSGIQSVVTIDVDTTTPKFVGTLSLE